MKPLTERSDPLGAISNPTDLEEQVRQRAYELYETRGREHGHDREDWLQAEAEIVGSRATATAIEEAEAGTRTRQAETRPQQAVTAA